MLTIPSADLAGCIADALHFISPDKEDAEHRCVHLRWDGRLFHASATDLLRVAVSSWSPEDQPDKDVQDPLGVELGSVDDPWEFLLSADDAAHLLKAAKPIKDLEYLPLFVDVDGSVMSVKRSKQHRVPGFALSYDGLPYGFADLRVFVANAMGAAEPVKEWGVNMLLAMDFGRVRQRGGGAKWTFAGADRPAVVEIGHRFVGAIQPIRLGEAA